MQNNRDLDTRGASDGGAALREQLLQLRLEAMRAKQHSARAIRPRGKWDRSIPLSYAQERLWFLDQIGLVGTAYNRPIALRLIGDVNKAALERAFSDLVRRHETLRTRFGVEDGVPYQLIDPPGAFALHQVDLSTFSDPQQREQCLREEIQREVRHRFDLSEGPLIRVVLVDLSRLEHALLIVIHHIISDGWSIGLVLRELTALYSAQVCGLPSPLPDLTVQYADYAIWQRQWLEGEVLETQLSYWKARLKGAPIQLQLPTDRPRPAIESFRGEIFRFHLPQRLVAALEELGRSERASLFMVTLAAFQLFLSRWSGQQDIVVGSPIAGRKDSELERMIGFFVNTLVLRTEIDRKLTFRQLLERVKETTLGAYAHQDLPFDRLVMELQPERNLTRQPIFQVMLALQNFPEERLDLAGLTWQSIDVEYVTTHFDLTLYLYAAKDGLSALLEYATDLFNRNTIERMAQHFVVLLEGILAGSDCPVFELPLLSVVEKHQLLMKWNATQTPYPRDYCVHELFCAQVNRNPEAPALTVNDETLSYLDLNERANRVAHRLKQLGVGPDVIVGVHLDRSVEMIVCFLGVLKAGGAYLPLNPTYPKERVQFMLYEAHASVVLSTVASAAQLPQNLMHLICLDRDAELLGQPTSNPSIEELPDQLAYVMYTSGSTGRPKAAGVTHRNIVRLLTGTDYIRIGAHDVFLQLSAPSFDASTFEIWGALLHGAKLVLYPDHEVDLDRLELILEREQVSVLWLTAGLFHQVMEERPLALLPLKWLLAGGDALSVSHVKRALEYLPDCRLINGYGPTEGTTFSTCFRITDPGLLESTVPIGRPIANTQVYVLDAELCPVPVGVSGELYIGGDGLARGYVNRPALTAERFVCNPFEPPGTRLYRTGDLVRWRADGTLEFMGRTDDQVKIRGYRVEPAEIEAAVLDHPAVKQALIVVQQDAARDRRLVCYVVGDRNATLDAAFAQEPEKARNMVVSQWETLYEETYGVQNQVCGPSFVGWNSSYTGEPIPEVEMQEWLANTIERVRALQPQRVLEIGCGVGLLLQHLAPDCLSYVGTDFSGAALKQLQQWMAFRNDLAHVELLQRPATELEDFRAGSFDTVILNSVVQYFPDIDYLMAVLKGAARLLVPGGRIFIGDVRDLRTLRMFHSAVLLGKAATTLRVAELRKRLDRAVSQDKELVIDSQFFRALPGNVPGFSAAEVHLKRGRSANELTRHRYDVTLHVGEQIGARVVCEPLYAPTAIKSPRQFEAALKERLWSTVHVTGIPNLGLSREAAGLRLIDALDDSVEVGALRHQLSGLSFDALDPENMWELAHAHDYDVTVSPGEPGHFDVRLCDRSKRDLVPRAVPPVHPVRLWSAYANDPLEHGFRQQLIAQLREYLKGRLPEYMVPSAWMVLKQFPLTPNGKVDRRALPVPEGRSEDLGNYVAPRTDHERTLAEIWAEVLRVDQVGLQDNFFEMGGHSLLGLKALSKINRRFGSTLKAIDIYRSPTVQELAARLSGTVAIDELVELSQEASLDISIVPCPNPPRTPARAVMLTGCTGFVGRFLLAQLLQDTDATIHCLVRADSLYTGRARIQQTLEKWDLWREEFADRILPVLGDLTQTRLGINESAYRVLCQDIDTIYHCATSMNHLETYGMAKAANVGGAKELLKIATRHRPKLVNYISTLGVFSTSSVGSPRIITEMTSIDEEQHRISRGYVASKWVGEKIFMMASERGIPCNIFRLGLIWADTQQGRYDPLQRGYRVLKSCLISGYGIENYHYESAPTPVDYAARAISLLAKRHSQGRGIFHISSSGQMTEGLFELCNAIANTSLKLMSFYHWIREMRRLHLAGRTLPAVPLIEYAFSMDEVSFREQQRATESTKLRFDCARTHRELEEYSIVAPVLEDGLLRLCLDRMFSMDSELRQVMGRDRRISMSTAADPAV